ncbi:MAG: hypothetical protein V1781_07280 [Bacteroidota bacterium]
MTNKNLVDKYLNDSFYKNTLKNEMTNKNLVGKYLNDSFYKNTLKNEMTNKNLRLVINENK